MEDQRCIGFKRHVSLYSMFYGGFVVPLIHDETCWGELVKLGSNARSEYEA